VEAKHRLREAARRALSDPDSIRDHAALHSPGGGGQGDTTPSPKPEGKNRTPDHKAARAALLAAARDDTLQSGMSREQRLMQAEEERGGPIPKEIFSESEAIRKRLRAAQEAGSQRETALAKRRDDYESIPGKGPLKRLKWKALKLAEEKASEHWGTGNPNPCPIAVQY